MQSLDDFRLALGGREYKPIMIGGMGVDISTRELALEAARLGGIGHISDAMAPVVVDRYERAGFARRKLLRNRASAGQADKSAVQFDLDELAEATRRHVSGTMERKRGDGAVFINCMEKLTMNNPAATLKVRLESALDAGVDGITLSAGLHLGSFALIADHPRFRDVRLGIIVSSLRALKLFLKKSARTGRLPDYVVVEGPLAGGHLGFGEDWASHDLNTIAAEVIGFLAAEDLDIPVIAAGGVFSGSDGVRLLQAGCAAVQVATRFTISRESGLPERVKQRYLEAGEDDIVVNSISPTGYLMRMLKSSPAIGARVPPNCEAYGYLLDKGRCPYLSDWYESETGGASANAEADKTCLCTQMRRHCVWTCGHYAYRLKETAARRPDGGYELPAAEHVFNDYLYSTRDEVHPPSG